MSTFIHCPDCRCAYDAARARGCPRCGSALAEPEEFGDQVIAAADRLASLLADASDADLDGLRLALDRELGNGTGEGWRRPLLEAIATRTTEVKPAALVCAPRAELASLEQQRTAASAALLFAVVTRMAQLARPGPIARPSIGRRALGLAWRAFSALG